MNSSVQFRILEQDVATTRPASTAAQVPKLVVKDLYKVFGDRPTQAIDMLNRGVDKERVLAETGQIVGVQGASFDVMPGEIFVIMGLSGSGKSTLVRLLNRLIEPSAGQVLVDGKDIARLSPKELLKVRREQMSMVFQCFALLPNRTVLDNVAFGLEVAGVARAEREERAMKMLERVGLEKFARMVPSQLSGGMQQRVGLARALCVNPAVVLMDEAFSALDPMIRKEMQDELLRLQAVERRTIVFISHDIEEALHIGNRIAIMKDGKVVQVGTPRELIRNPANEFVHEFFKGVDISRYLTAVDLMEPDIGGKIVITDEVHAVAQASAHLHAHRREYGYVCTMDDHFLGVVSTLSLEQAVGGPVRTAFLSDVVPVPTTTNMHDLIAPVGASPAPLPVIDQRGRLCGTVSSYSIVKQYQKTR